MYMEYLHECQGKYVVWLACEQVMLFLLNMITHLTNYNKKLKIYKCTDKKIYLVVERPFKTE